MKHIFLNFIEISVGVKLDLMGLSTPAPLLNLKNEAIGDQT